MAAPTPRTAHALKSPALRVGVQAAVREDITPVGQRKFASRTERKAAPTERKKGVQFEKAASTVNVRAEKRVQFQKSASHTNVVDSEKRVLNFVTSSDPPAKDAIPVVSVSVVAKKPSETSMRLTSALAAAYRATMGGSLNFARRIYDGILRDSQRFRNVDRSVTFWLSFALFEEHCGKFVASLQCYERALEFAQDSDSIQANLYCFKMRMEDRILKALDETSDAAQNELQAIQAFAEYVRLHQSEEEEPSKPDQTVVAVMANLDTAMKAVSAQNEEVIEQADRGAQLMEEADEEADAGPRRSERLASKERRNYANNIMPWWLDEDSEWLLQ